VSTNRSTVLVVGATGSIGIPVVAEALHAGYAVRALVRDLDRARELAPEAMRVVGNLTRAETLQDAVAGVDAIVFTHGTYDDAEAAERVDYGGVRNTLAALGTRQVRIALMTTIGVTFRTSADRSGNERHDWKRRGERLVRVSGLPYTIVRPGWFDYNGADEEHLVLLQGDRRHAGDPSDGAVSRRQIAQVLVASLTSDAALRKSFELVSVKGPAQDDLDPLFAPLDADARGALDAAHDLDNMPLVEEPQRVRDDLDAVRTRHAERDEAPHNAPATAHSAFSANAKQQ